MNGDDQLPDEVVLDRAEATIVLFALDEAIAAAHPSTSLHERLVTAAQLIVSKFLPDLGDL